jgi:hypothetical protein
VNHLVPAQAGAQLVSLAAYIALALWYVAPWLAKRRRAEALIALLWIHVFRYVALQIFSAQQEGFPISTSGALEIVVGDVGGAIIAFAAIVLLRRRSGWAVLFCWLLVIETATDTVLNIRGGIEEHLMGAATGVVWMVLVFYVPAIVVSIGLLAWQLVTRRHEAISPNAQPTEAPLAGARLQEQQ